jgi:hypothetical protein
MVAEQLFRCGADTQGRLSSERCGAVTAESLVEISIDTQSLSPGSKPSVDLPLWRVEDLRTASASISRQSPSSSASCHILSSPTYCVWLLVCRKVRFDPRASGVANDPVIRWPQPGVLVQQTVYNEQPPPSTSVLTLEMTHDSRS